MYYKIKTGSITHQKLEAIFEKMKNCNAASRELMNEVGATRLYRSNFEKAGGAYSFVFDEKPPTELWKAKDGGWFPRANRKENKALLKKIEKLPTVGIIEYANIFNCDPFIQPGCFQSEGVFYANGRKIEGDDFEEIKMSEWALAKEALPV